MLQLKCWIKSVIQTEVWCKWSVWGWRLTLDLKRSTLKYLAKHSCGSLILHVGVIDFFFLNLERGGKDSDSNPWEWHGRPLLYISELVALIWTFGMKLTKQQWKLSYAPPLRPHERFRNISHLESEDCAVTFGYRVLIKFSKFQSIQHIY